MEVNFDRLESNQTEGEVVLTRRRIMYDKYSLIADEFISDEEINETLKYADENRHNAELIRKIIKKAKERKGLDHREASVLLACDIPELEAEIFELAGEIKRDFYGERALCKS